MGKRGPNRIRMVGDIAYIELTDRQGSLRTEALIDAADVALIEVSGLRWHANWDKKYKQYKVGAHVKENGKWAGRVLLHRFILGVEQDVEVDHRNHNTLDNRRNNLRRATRSQNMQNRQSAQRNSGTSIRGVSWNKRERKWKASITLNKRKLHLGTFDNLAEAEAAAVKARRKHMTYSQN